MDRDPVRIYGYVATSEFDKNPTSDEQVRQIEERAAEIEGDFVGCRVEAGQGPLEPYWLRPEFMSSLRRVCENDHIIVYGLDVIDANPHRLDTALRPRRPEGLHPPPGKTRW